MEQALLEKAKIIKVLLLDVDGVLTDGRIIYDSAGKDMKLFDVHDGMGVHLLKKAGIPTILITAKGSKAIKPRAKDMQVDAVYENITPKSNVLGAILSKYKINGDQICFMGDDLVDLCLMKRVGFPVAVANAADDIKSAASYVTLKKGGRGAVREIAELILKAQGKWDSLVASYDV